MGDRPLPEIVGTLVLRRASAPEHLERNMRRFVPDAHLTVVHMDAAHIDVEKTISDIELLEQLLSLRDPRPLRESDVCAANQRHDTLNAQNPWFRLWQRYGIPA